MADDLVCRAKCIKFGRCGYSAPVSFERGRLRMGAGRLRRVLIILLALAISNSQAFQLAAPGSEEAQHHHHHDHGHAHDHAHDHAHGHDHHEHNTKENLNGVISDIFEGGGNEEVREGKAVSETLEEAVARGGVDFSEAEVITEEDGTVKECVEKEEIREEYR